MSKHTPGPWLIKEANIFSRHPEHKKCLQGIAYVYGLSDFNVSNANTRLIAAAPELLEALENLLKVHEGEGGTQYHAGDMARAAIAKARGE